MTSTPVVLSTPILGGQAHGPSSTSTASPRRPSYPTSGPSSPPPRLPRTSTPSRLPSISSNQALEIAFADSPAAGARTNVVTGFNLSPSGSGSKLPSITNGYFTGSPTMSSTSLMSLNTTASSSTYRARLSPQPTTPIETFPNNVDFPSPRPAPHSPRGFSPFFDAPPRSRRNSALVSISLSTRSRSRTPRGSAAALPSDSGQATPNKSKDATPRGQGSGSGFKGREVDVQMLDHPMSPGWKEMDDWSPAGGMLLHDEEDDEFDEGGDSGDVMDEDVYDGDGVQKTWSGVSDASRVVEDVLKPGMIFGEGLEFQGEVIVPAVGRLMTTETGEKVGMPLRRGGSEAGVGRGTAAVGGPEVQPAKKSYEVVRQLGSGSYAVVYLVKERGGRKREYALKCLSKHDLEGENLETQLFEATIHLSLPIHTNIVTLHQTLQTKKWLFLMLELCPGEDLFYWLEKSRDASPPSAATQLQEERSLLLSSSTMSSSSIPFSSSQMFPSITGPLSFSHSPSAAFSPNYSHSPASLLFAHHNGSHHYHATPSQTPPTPSLLSAFSANTLLTSRRLRLIASMFSQMCEAVAVCHDAGISHRDIKPENFICCDSVELEAAEGDDGQIADQEMDFGPQAKRKVVVKLTDFGLATTEEESGDVECGSKPYMSYECRNNLGPTYLPAPADVWSLGIVLINMLFHRNPWKDPCPGDPNFDNFLNDPTAFLLTKFTGIGKEVATFLADHVLCIDVEARTSARELGIWIKGLPNMIGGRKAIHAMKVARLDTSTSIPNHNANSHSSVNGGDSGLFVKSPVDSQTERKASWTSALTSSAPGLPPALSTLPPPSQLSISHRESTLPTPDLDRDDLKSASTYDEQPTPLDRSEFASPEPDGSKSPIDRDDDADSRSLSTTKRRKRGVRKGKAAQAALALAASADGPTQAERDALLAELAIASQSLARDLSKVSSTTSFDPSRIEDFPPLGTTPSQLAAAKKSKWKDLMRLSHGNPELAALARRVSERDDVTGGNWSAPAKLQAGSNKSAGGVAGQKPSLRHTATATATTSSGFSSALSSFGPVSSATSSSGGPDDDDWRKPVRPAAALAAAPASASAVGVGPSVAAEEQSRGRDQGIGVGHEQEQRRRKNESTSRARQAALAAAAITGSFDQMGSFGKRPDYPALGGGVGGGLPPIRNGLAQAALHHQQQQQQHHSRKSITESVPIGSPTARPLPNKSGVSQTRHLGPIIDETWPSSERDDDHHQPILSKFENPYPITPSLQVPQSQSFSPNTMMTSQTTRPSISSVESSRTITVLNTSSSLETADGQSILSKEGYGNGNENGNGIHPHGPSSTNKPKLKGQIQSLAKMLSGLKTKGKD